MPIDPTTQIPALAAIIRQALQQSGQARGGVGSAQQGARPQVKGRSTSPKRGAATSGKPRDLAETIGMRVAALQPDDPQYQRRVLRVIVEAALLDELGEGLINAPKFQGIVELVVGELEASSLMSRDIAAVMSQLSEGRASTASPPASASKSIQDKGKPSR